MEISLFDRVMRTSRNSDGRIKLFCEVIEKGKVTSWGVKITHEKDGKTYTIFITPSKLIIQNGNKKFDYHFNDEDSTNRLPDWWEAHNNMWCEESEISTRMNKTNKLFP